MRVHSRAERTLNFVHIFVMIVTKEVILMPILYSYTPEEVEKFKAKLKQAEERAAFFEQAYKQEQAKNSKLQQQQKAD